MGGLIISVMKLKRNFYTKPSLLIAQKLLGKYLLRRIERRRIVTKIVETEAYIGTRDLASHASHGRTKRTELMFDTAGHAYIYLIYGLYYCFNITTERKGFPAAILIRAVEPIKPRLGNIHLTNGPAKLCRYLKINRKLNGLDLTGNILWLEDRGEKIPQQKIVATKRIGVDYAGSWKNKKWRFYLKDNPFVSKKTSAKVSRPSPHRLGRHILNHLCPRSRARGVDLKSIRK